MPHKSLLIGDTFEIFLYGNKGLNLKGVHYNLVELFSRNSLNDKRIRGVRGTPIKGELVNVCGWGVEGKWENLPIKLMFQFIFQITCLSL